MEYISKFPKGNSREINKVLSISIYIVVCLRQSWSFGSFHTHLYPPSPDPPVYITCFVRLMSVCEVVLGHQHRLPNSLRKPSSECRSFTGDWALSGSPGMEHKGLSHNGAPTSSFVRASSSFRLCPQVGAWPCLAL